MNTDNLPNDVAKALEDRSIFVPADASVFKLIAEWTEAPSNTVSAVEKRVER